MLGNDMVLTIGLPLVSGLNTRQFAGVLAHEFGHFAQGAGMRLTYIIRTISHWLLRVVYQRDRADAWLEETTASLDIRIGWVFYLAMLFVWITRRILWVLMQIGNIVGSFLLRQMEFDADRYETRLAGSEAFEQTARQLHYLNYAAQHAYSDLRDFYREGQLGDDLPRLIVSKVGKIPKEVKQEIDKSIESTGTGLFDTHPADRDRIASAHKENTSGIFQLEIPASILFTDYEAQSKATTWEFYREQFGNSLKKNQLRPVTEMFAKEQQSDSSQEAVARFFQNNWHIGIPLPLRKQANKQSQSSQENLDTLKRVRKQMLAECPKANTFFEPFGEFLNTLMSTYYLRYCLRANLKVELKDKQLKQNPSAWVKQKIESTERNIANSKKAVEGFQNLAAERLYCALHLLQVQQVAKRISDASQWQKKYKLQLECLQVLSDRMETILKVVRLTQPLQAMVNALQSGSREDDVITVLEGLVRELYPLLNEARNSWKHFDYPYEHSHRELSLSAYLMPTVPIKDDLESIYAASDELVETVPQLYNRLLGDLVMIAEAVETAVGLQPQPASEVVANEIQS